MLRHARLEVIQKKDKQSGEFKLWEIGLWRDSWLAEVVAFNRWWHLSRVDLVQWYLVFMHLVPTLLKDPGPPHSNYYSRMRIQVAGCVMAEPSRSTEGAGSEGAPYGFPRPTRL